MNQITPSAYVDAVVRHKKNVPILSWRRGKYATRFSMSESPRQRPADFRDLISAGTVEYTNE